MTLEKLKNIAMAATKGPWSVKSGTQIRSEKDQIAKVWMMRNGEGKCNGEHITTFNPDTVLKLIESLEEAKKALELEPRMNDFEIVAKNLWNTRGDMGAQAYWVGGLEMRNVFNARRKQALAAIEERLGSIGGV